jgi:Mrp family chromosome partitioning ATPase
MTIINRALNKAYKRRSDADPGQALEQRPPSVSGWAPTLREPIRPIPSPERSVSTSPAIPKEPEESPALPAPSVPPAMPGLSVAPAGATVRIDPGHVPSTPAVPAETPVTAIQPTTTAELPHAESAARWSWPPIVRKLLDSRAGPELRKLAASLKQLAATHRLGCLALSGPGRTTGRTSLVLTLAHILAETQFCRVAIVDADFGHPAAADLLSLNPRTGLWDAACQKGAGASVEIPLIPEKLAIVPLVEPVTPEALDRQKIAALQTFLRLLRRDYDLVLVDAGPWESLVPPLVFESRSIDAFLCVARCDAADERLDDEHYRQPGIEWLGMIETFAPAMSSEQRIVQKKAG